MRLSLFSSSVNEINALLEGQVCDRVERVVFF
jgi:hypothetical protein